MTDDFTNDPAWREWVADAREYLVPRLNHTPFVMALVPEAEPDIKFAVELGLSIMMDKPLALIVQPGTPIPEHLVRAADHIVEADPRTEQGQQRIQEFINARIEEIDEP